MKNISLATLVTTQYGSLEPFSRFWVQVWPPNCRSTIATRTSGAVSFFLFHFLSPPWHGERDTTISFDLSTTPLLFRGRCKLLCRKAVDPYSAPVRATYQHWQSGALPVVDVCREDVLPRDRPASSQLVIVRSKATTSEVANDLTIVFG